MNIVRQFGIAFFQLLSVLAFIAGVGYFFSATGTPGQYRMYSASAVQITQVYAEATYYAILSAACIMMGIFIQIALFVGYPRSDETLAEIRKDAAASRSMLGKIGKLMQQRQRETAFVE